MLYSLIHSFEVVSVVYPDLKIERKSKKQDRMSSTGTVEATQILDRTGENPKDT